MTDTSITQAEADSLLVLEKVRVDETVHSFPGLGGTLAIPLASTDSRESFILDVWRSQINLVKGKHQARARGSIVLARLDFGGSPHRNPDDEEIVCPHLHIYREGYGTKWAYPLPPEHFAGASTAWEYLQSFMSYVKVVRPPHLDPDLFT